MKNINYNEKIEKVENEIKLIKKYKSIIEKKLKFNIPEYLIMTIVEEVKYDKFCVLVNLAKNNNKITEEESVKLKKFIKEMCDKDNKISINLISKLENQ